MESLFILGLLAFLAGPVLAIIALAKISGLDRRIAELKLTIENMATAAASSSETAPPRRSRRALEVAKDEAATVSGEVPDLAASPQMSRNWSSQAATRDEPDVSSAAKEPDMEAAKEAAPAAASPDGRDVEQALASRWFVWVGGAAVALGGLLFVKYAHDNGLIPPVLRVIIGLAFGGGLVAAGEWIRRKGGAVAESYVPAALSAAGLVTLFGVIYAAYALYGLVGPGFCFPALVAVGLGALWLSRLQGPLIGALGLVGSYAAPALVPSEHPSAWGFFAYLLVIVAASLYELRLRPWWWLGFSAIAGATLWGLLWSHGGFFEPSHILPASLFALVLGAAASFIPVGRGILAAEMGTLADPANLSWPMRVAITGIAAAAVLLAGIVWQSAYGTSALVFFAIGMIAITAFGWLREGMVAAPIAAALASLIVLMAWPDVGFHEWAMDERGLWSTVPGLIAPPRFRNAMFVALVFFTAVGLWEALKRSEARPWAALAGASSVLFLFGAWGRADFTLGWLAWTVIGAALAVLLAGIADRIRENAPRATELLLAGSALLALFAIDRAFDGVWQTIAIAVLAAAFAYATKRFTLVWIAAIAAALASLAAIRLFVGREFWGEPANVPWGGHWVIYGYGIPAVLFWLASRWLTQESFARYRAALEGLALGLAIALVSLELRVLIGGGITSDNLGLLELSAHALAWLGAAYGLAYRQQLFSSFVSLWGARALLAASSLALFAGLTLRNPVVEQDVVQGGTFINALWLAYLAPVPLLALMARKLEGLGLAKLRNALGIFALVLLVAFVTLQVKRLFQGPLLEMAFLTQPESYTTSAAWIVLGIAIFLGGIGLDRQTIRYGGLAVLVLAILKVFALDLFELGGLWRIASIIGLGLCLIGVGWLYTKFIQKPQAAGAPARA